ncbi:FAD:protein FMN transferase [Bacteroides xylanisolvens]
MFPILFSSAARCTEKSEYHVLSGERHTYYRITYNYPYDLNEDILFIYDVFYESLNPFDQQSTLSKVNNNEAVILDTIFIEAFNRSMELADKTRGAFDPTCSPLINLWGFGFKNMENPSDSLIKEIREYVGHNKVSLKNDSIQKEDSRLQLNFSAIGDGLSCDIIARYLDSKDVNDYMVDIGGEIVSKGKNKAGNNWSVGVIKPPKYLGADKFSEFEIILHLTGKMAIATSGNYNNYRSQNGKRYGHTINLHTGYPANNRILSVTVIAGDCTTADAYATAIMAVEASKLNELLLTNGEMEYYIIYLDEQDNYCIKQSGNMDRYM